MFFDWDYFAFFEWLPFFLIVCFLSFFSGGNYKFPICFKAELQIRLNMWLGRGVRSPFFVFCCIWNLFGFRSGCLRVLTWFDGSLADG